MRADADRVGGWVVQESFRRHVHSDGTWSLLHLGSGRWVRVMRDSGLLAAEAVTLEAAERFGVQHDPLGSRGRRRGGRPRRRRRRRGRQRPAPLGARDRGSPAPAPARLGGRRVAHGARRQPARRADDRLELPVRARRRGGGCRDRRLVEPRRSGARPRHRRRALGRPRAHRPARAELARHRGPGRRPLRLRHAPPGRDLSSSARAAAIRVRSRLHVRAGGRTSPSRSRAPQPQAATGDAPARRVRARRAGPGGPGGRAGAQRR